MLAHAVDYVADSAVDFPALRARAHMSGPFDSVDFPALRTRAHISAPVVLWIRGEMWGAGHRGVVVHFGRISV